MPTPEDSRATQPVSDYDFWMAKKGEKMGTQLSGYVRVMFVDEAQQMLESGRSDSDEWFEVWDGILPPIVYQLIESNAGKHQHYQHVLFISVEDAQQVGISVYRHHPNYSKLFPAVVLNNMMFRSVRPDVVIELTHQVRARLQTLPPPGERKRRGTVWQYARIARERVV